MIEMEQVKEENPSTEQLNVGGRFVEITKQIIEIGKQYDEISPATSSIFMDSLSSFIDIQRLINDNPEVDLNSNHIKMALFESTFGFDFDGTVQELIKSRISANGYDDGSSNASDEDINNVDKDLLKDIKANIQDYLKD